MRLPLLNYNVGKEDVLILLFHYSPWFTSQNQSETPRDYWLTRRCCIHTYVDYFCISDYLFFVPSQWMKNGWNSESRLIDTLGILWWLYEYFQFVRKGVLRRSRGLIDVHEVWRMQSCTSISTAKTDMHAWQNVMHDMPHDHLGDPFMFAALFKMTDMTLHNM